MTKEFAKGKDPTRDLTLKHHNCLIYDTAEEWQRMVIPFLAAGLAKQEKCLYLMDRILSLKITTCLENEGFEGWTLQKYLTFYPIREVFLLENQFDPYQATLFLTEQARQANREGYTSLRFCVEMGGILPYISDPEFLTKYENLLNRFIFSKYNCTGVCLYEAWKFEPEFLLEMEAAHAHPQDKRRSRYDGLMLEVNH